MTVSTGIGGGIVIDDRLLLGARGLGAELGHVSIMLNGPKCGCGQRGHLEALASGSAIAAWVKEQLANGRASAMKSTEPVTAKVVAQAAVMGDSLACEAMKRAGDFIGRALANYLHIFNPTVIIIGGGVSLSGDQIMNPIRDSLEKYVLTPHYLENLIVTTAALGDEAGLMGALIQARELTGT
jgi:glucokinase